MRLKSVVRQLGATFILVWLLVVITFGMVRLVPGDPAARIGGLEASPEVVERNREELGLNDPLPVQFASYVEGIATFDLGRSFVTNQPVADIIRERLPRTIRLAVTAFALVIVVSVPLGVAIGALTRGSQHPRSLLGFTVATSIGGAVPEFLAGTLLAAVFAVWLRLLPVAGASSGLSVILPAVALSIRPIALLSRLVRAETANVLAQDYIRTARSKRLTQWRLYSHHVLRNVMTGALTLGGVILAGLLGGAIVVENVFAWQGIGTSVVHAVHALDYPVVQGTVLVYGAGMIIVTRMINVIIGVLDPRTLLTDP